MPPASWCTGAPSRADQHATAFYVADVENRRMVTHFCDGIGRAVQGRKISIEPPSGQKAGSGAKVGVGRLCPKIIGLGALSYAMR